VTARRVAVVGLTAVAALYIWPVQPAGENQNANFALTKSLSHGSPRLDATHSGPARIVTQDTVFVDGHWYAAKPPGLAAASIPVYLLLERAGMETSGDVTRALWVLHLWAVVLPALLLLVLVARVADRVESGFGLLAAVMLGIATLVLPFSTLFFVHVLAAALGFAAFAVLWHERERPPRLRLVGLAGLLAGLAALVDYPLALLVAVLWPYASARAGRARRAAAYAGGAAVGVGLILLYNVWAFGSPLHFPYHGWHATGEEPLGGLFGAAAPSLRVGLELLFVPAGVAILAPAAVGIVLLSRRGFRAEAWTIAAASTVFLLHNAASVQNPFGGASPGPRHLIPILPFLAVPLAAAARRIPGPTLGLAAGGAIVELVYTATTPLAAWDGLAWRRFLDGDVIPTLADPLGIEGRLAVVPLFVAAAAAFSAALARARPVVGRRQLAAGALAVGAWAALVASSRRLLFDGTPFGPTIVLAAFTITAGVVALLLLAEPRATIARCVRHPRHSWHTAIGAARRG
jgi:hypothetical protein